MDAVKSFNMELSSLYEVKPPISKAKMTALTRGAIKAIKFYKHVVQSVEKFILKCKPDYKVPGLYVIDSIVRQSRHQFGSDKDVFAPRFAKNMQQTFVNLFKCPAEDKSKIIRVLNLWQKNHVFQPDVIQPLFDLADPNNPIYKELENSMQQSANGLSTSTASIIKGSPALQRTPTKGNQQGNDSLHGASTNLNLTDPNVLQQLQQLQRLITKNVENSSRSDQVHFDKKLLDYDYGDDDDDVHPSPRQQQPTAESILPVTSLLTNPEVLRQLQTLQQTMVNAVQPQNQDMDMDKMRKLQEMKQQEEEFDKHLAQTVPNLPFASECDFRGSANPMIGNNYFLEGMNPPAPHYQPEFEMSNNQSLDKSHSQDNSADVEVITLDHDDSRSPSPDDRYKKRRRSRSRSRDRRGRDRDRRRSRSRSGSRRRNRSRSRDRNDRSKKDKDKEKSKEDKEKETERERERKKRGLPVMKKDYLSICSTTLWVGHLSKLVHQDDLSNTFGEFGDVVSIDLIPPRGCAFIVMLRRQDAARCLTKLKGHNLHGKCITLAWAPGKGVKGKDLKDYWEGDLGVSYIPFAKLKHDIDIDLIEDGGMIDEETMPDWMREKVEKMGKKPSAENVPSFMPPTAGTPIDTSQPPPMPGAGLLQPPPMMPLVNPFQFNNRLLSMNVPPGMMPNMGNLSTIPNMPNIPIGVPPPNMAGPPMMSNQLLSLGSPFQGHKHHLLGPPNMMPPQLPSVDNKSGVNADASLHSLGESLMNLTQSFGVVPQPPAPHEDTMDIEMEDADKPMDKPPQFNDQASGPFGRGRDDDRRDRRDDRDRRNRSRERDRDNTRERDRDRSRDRHSRDRGDRRYNRGDRDLSRGRDRDRRDDRRDNRDDRRDNRDRNNRWGDRDRRDRDNDDKREREKTLNDRLREMAGMGGFEDPRDRNRERFRDRDNNLKFVPPPRSNGRPEDEFMRDRDGPFRQRDRFDRNDAPNRRRTDDGPSGGSKLNDSQGRSDRTKSEEKDMKNDDKSMSEGTPKEENSEHNLEGELDSKQDENSLGKDDGGQKGSENSMDGPSGEISMDAPTGPDMLPEAEESLDNEQGFPPMSFEGPPPFEGIPPFDGPPMMFDGPPMFSDGPPPRGLLDGPPRGIFDDGPPMGIFNDMFEEMRDGPPRGLFDDGPPMMFDDGGPPMMFDDGGPPMMFDDMMDGPPGMRGGVRGRGRGRRGRFPMRMDGPPDIMDMPPPGMMDGPPMMDGPDMLDGPPQFRDDRFMRGGRRGMRGPPDNEFFPRDDFRAPMRGRGRGRGQFFPRGRGGRGGFNPRFDGPPSFDGPPFEGGPPPFDGPLFPGPPFDGPPFDEPPFDGPGPPFDGPFRGPRGRGFRHGRFEDRTWVRPDFKQPAKGGRRSRWGGEQEEESMDGPPQMEGESDLNDGPPQEREDREFVEHAQIEGGEDMGGNREEPEINQDGKSTPVIDERPPPQEHEDAVAPPGTDAAPAE